MDIVIQCEDVNEAVDFFTQRLGFRLEMIAPADDPSIALVSGHGVRIRFERSAPSKLTLENAAKPEKPLPSSVTAAVNVKTSRTDISGNTLSSSQTPDIPLVSHADDAKWLAGRAGMEYRDLIPGRLGGILAASHIRLGDGGEVADYVHYHKVRFQMIYCWHGKVKVVYEGQGEPFWLHPGDCVLQPPEIRHRVLESSSGAQVIELTSPAVHETWADHDLQLPNARVFPDRDFAGQHFILHRAADSTPQTNEFGDFETHDIGITAASHNTARVFELRTAKDHSSATVTPENDTAAFYFVLSGRLNVAVSDKFQHHLTTGDAITLPHPTAHTLNATANSEILAVFI